jgi:hypothetical protein
VPLRWFAELVAFGDRKEPLGLVSVPSGSPARGLARWRGSAAIAVWAGPAGLLPPALVVEAAGSLAPREVVGGDFQEPMLHPGTGTVPVLVLAAGDRRAGTGLRLCATAKELLLALSAATPKLAAGEAEQLRRFVGRAGHRQVLAPVWRRLFPTPPPGELAAVLTAALEGGP